MTFNTEKKVRLRNAIIGWIAIKRSVAKEEEKMQLVGGSSSTSSTPSSPATAATHLQHKLPKVLQFDQFFSSTTFKQLKNVQLPQITGPKVGPLFWGSKGVWGGRIARRVFRRYSEKNSAGSATVVLVCQKGGKVVSSFFTGWQAGKGELPNFLQPSPNNFSRDLIISIWDLFWDLICELIWEQNSSQHWIFNLMTKNQDWLLRLLLVVPFGGKSCD